MNEADKNKSQGFVNYGSTNTEGTNKSSRDDEYIENLTRILEFIPDPLFAISLTGTIIVWNKAMSDLTGQPADTMIGKGDYEHGLALYGIRRPMIIDLIINPELDIGLNYKSISRDGDAFLAEARMPLSNGKIADLWGKAGPLYDGDGKIIGAIESIRDISSIKKIERNLRESEHRYRTIIDSSPIEMHFYVLHDDESLIFAGSNPAGEALLKTSYKELVGRTIEDAFPALIKTDIPAHYKRIARDGGKWESDYIDYDGGAIRRAGKITAFQIDENMIVTQFVDITSMKKTEEALRISEEKFRTIFENMPLGFFRTNKDGKLLEANPTCAKIFGYDSVYEMSSIIGSVETELYVNPRNRHTLMSEAMKDKSLRHYTYKLRKKDGTPFPANIMIRYVGNPDGDGYFEGLIEDGTEHQRIEEMMIQSEKMITIAGLTAGMAHEINNPLGIIMQTAENAIRRLTAESEANLECAKQHGIDFSKMQDYLHERKIDHYLEGIRSAGLRASEIVKNMLQFSRRSESKMAPYDVNTLINNSLELAANDFDLNKRYDFRLINIVRSYEHGLRIRCTETEIEQVFLNIMKNAAQAMMLPENPTVSPSIRIVTTRIGNNAIITISDNGPGMDEKTTSRIFEPFFSTKDAGVGTGLGLSVSYFIIVTNHQGKIEVDSEPGIGTTFTISLPLLREGSNE